MIRFPFLFEADIPLYIYTTYFLFSPPLMDKFPYPDYYKYCCNNHGNADISLRNLLHFLPRVGLLDHNVGLFLIFEGTFILFSVMLFTPTVYKGSLFSTSLSTVVGFFFLLPSSFFFFFDCLLPAFSVVRQKVLL